MKAKSHQRQYQWETGVIKGQLVRHEYQQNNLADPTFEEKKKS